MMASLIHTNREATDPIDTDDDATFRSSKKKSDSSSPEPSTSRRRTRRQLTLDTSFRPVKKQAVEEPSSDGEEDELFDAEEWEEGKSKGKGRRKREYDGPTATLVVAPVSLLHQWESELKKSAKRKSLRVFSEFLSSTSLLLLLFHSSSILLAKRVAGLDRLLKLPPFGSLRSRHSLPRSRSRGWTRL